MKLYLTGHTDRYALEQLMDARALMAGMTGRAAAAPKKAAYRKRGGGEGGRMERARARAANASQPGGGR